MYVYLFGKWKCNLWKIIAYTYKTDYSSMGLLMSSTSQAFGAIQTFSRDGCFFSSQLENQMTAQYCPASQTCVQ